MFHKIYLSRAQTRAMSVDYPIGDATGGAAYGELRDPVTAAIGGAAASLGSSLIGGLASNKAAGTQAAAAEDARGQQIASQIATIQAQQDILGKQIEAAGGVATEQQLAQRQSLQQQLDQTQQQVQVAAETRDRQLALSQMTKDEQIAFAGKTKDEQLAIARDVLGRQEAAYQPYQQAGLAGQGQLLNYLGIGADKTMPGYGQYATAEFTPAAFEANQDPGYAFRFKQGMDALNRSAAARGGMISGGALKAATDYGQAAGSQEYQNAFNRYQTSRSNTLNTYQGLQGTGMQAAGGLAGAAGNYGQTGFNALANYGQAGQSAIGTAGAQGIGALGGYGQAAGQAYGTAGQAYNTAGAQASQSLAQQGNATQSAYGNYIGGLTGALTGYGQSTAGLTTDIGQATASGYMGGANALAGGVSNMTNQYYQNQLLNTLNDKNALQAGGWTDAQANQFMGSYK